eukprot:109828-Rhodomonas_salina.2
MGQSPSRRPWQLATLRPRQELRVRTLSGTSTPPSLPSTPVSPPASLSFTKPNGPPPWRDTPAASSAPSRPNTSTLGCEVLCDVLQDKTLPEKGVWDLLQARSFCFPTATIVARNHRHKGYPDTICTLCRKHTDHL